MIDRYKTKNNPRVIVIQKIYGKFFNKDEDLIFPKHRFKKFIKDVVNGTIERNEIIVAEIENYLSDDVKLNKLDKVFQVIIKSAIFEFLYKTNIPTKIIIKEYLNASNFFLEDIAFSDNVGFNLDVSAGECVSLSDL